MATILLRGTPGDRPPLVLLVETPEVALQASASLREPRPLGTHRGLSALAGSWANESVAIQATGLGAPAMAMVVEELLMIGAHRFLYLAGAMSIDPLVAAGDLVIPMAAAPADGATRSLGGVGSVAPAADLGLVTALCARLPPAVPTARIHTGTSVTVDVPLDAVGRQLWRARGALCADMGAAPLLYLCRRPATRAAAACVLLAADPAAAGPSPSISEEVIKACLASLTSAGD